MQEDANSLWGDSNVGTMEVLGAEQVTEPVAEPVVEPVAEALTQADEVALLQERAEHLVSLVSSGVVPQSVINGIRNAGSDTVALNNAINELEMSLGGIDLETLPDSALVDSIKETQAGIGLGEEYVLRMAQVAGESLDETQQRLAELEALESAPQVDASLSDVVGSLLDTFGSKIAGFSGIAAGFAGLFSQETESQIDDIRNTMSGLVVDAENLGNGVDGSQLDVAVAQGLTSEAARQAPAQGQGVSMSA